MKRFLLVVLLFVVALILWMFVIPFAKREDVRESLMANGRPECPLHGSMFVPDSGGTFTTGTQTIAGSGAATYVPEYHDCQRFMLDGPGKKYGPLVAIFARFHLEALGDPPALVTTFVPTTTGAPTVTAVGSIGLANLHYISLGTENGTERAVATILNYDDAYDPLHIPRGYSCLYVYHQDPKTWAARLVQAASDGDCVETMDTLNRTFWPLAVTPYDDPGPQPVARWDWDSGTKEQYVGIRCGSRWCEVYNPDKPHNPSPTYPGHSKGSYDEQVLAESTTEPGHPDDLKPGNAIGTAFPIGNLEANTEQMYTNAWIPVAQVSLSDESAVYKGKYKFGHRPGEEAPYGKNFVSFCMGPKSTCVPLQFRAGIPNCGNAADPWWARIEGPDGTKYRCVIRRLSPTGAPLPPGVVRWRWKLKDEGMWVRCPGGCCEKT